MIPISNPRLSSLRGFLIVLMSCISSIEVQAQVQVQIDGLSGAVTPADYASKPIVCHPGDAFTVQIQNANLISYSYEIVMGKEEKLSRSYYVVGLGDIAETGAPSFASVQSSGLKDFDRLKSPVGLNKEQDKLLQHVLNALISSQETITRVRMEKDLLLSFYQDSRMVIDAGKEEWADGIKKKVKEWPQMWRDVMDKIRSNQDALGILSTRLAIMQIGDSNAHVEFDDAVQGLIDEGQKTNDSLLATVQNINSIYSRWATTIYEHPRPELSQTFLVGNGSKKYVVYVRRRNLHPAMKDILGNTDASTGDTTVFASIPFEGHPMSMFNFSIGVGTFYNPGAKSYSYLRDFSIKDSIAYRLAASGTSDWTQRPLAMFGIYWSPVDDLDKDRGCRWMCVLGFELKLPVNNFVVGIGLDAPFGMVVSTGINFYTATTPAQGSAEGLIISKATYESLNGSVPTTTKSNIGGYLSLGLRPAIFDAIYGFIYPSSK